MTKIEYYGNFIRPTGTNRVISMPYACLNVEDCIPYNIIIDSGEYKIEFWGASGGDVIIRGNLSVEGGFGGYVKGNLITNSSLSLYFYVGAKGYQAETASYNGGGRGPSRVDAQGQGACGGGSTDVRITVSSLESRFMVAGAGGGACSYDLGI